MALIPAWLFGATLAGAHCRIDVLGPERAEWAGAAAELDASLARASFSNQCAVVVVVADSGLADLTFVARDGRSTQRRIEDPIELVPTVQALSVEAPEAAAALPSASSAHIAAKPASADRATPGRSPEAAQPYELAPIFGAQMGVRYGADDLLSPVIGGFAAIPVGRWELGILGRLEGHYMDASSGNDESSPETSAVGFGVSAGRHEPLGKVGLRAGLIGLVAAIDEDQGNKSGQAEMRVGAYLGGVWPERGRLGLRADLAAELVPYNVGQSQTNALGALSLPWWGLTSTLGLEIR